MDFVQVVVSKRKKENVIYPNFHIDTTTRDIIIRGGAFYAFWDEVDGVWSRDELLMNTRIDELLDARYFEEIERDPEVVFRVEHICDSSDRQLGAWKAYIRHVPDNIDLDLDGRVLFADHQIVREDYATKKLPYLLSYDSTPAYDELMSTLYSPDERRKIEWAIGSIISGDSVDIQKFFVFYGSAGSGKSTVLNLIQDLFEGYYSVFESKQLGQSNSSFSLSQFKENPLVAIEHDGDLSRIEDNSRLNSIVSHEKMSVNEKFKSLYTMRFRSSLFIGTNRPVKITDAKSGLMRRLVDIQPTGNTLTIGKYRMLTEKMQFELGGIAGHCLNVYRSMGMSYYDDYKPLAMMWQTNDFYNFIQDNYHIFVHTDPIDLNQVWRMYKEYCEDANVPYPYTRRQVKSELTNYYKTYDMDIYEINEDGKRIHRTNVYSMFLKEKFFGGNDFEKDDQEQKKTSWIELSDIPSILDRELSTQPAQLATRSGTPKKKWVNVETTLEDIDTKKVHYVKIPESHIVIDFDIPVNGAKSLALNLRAAEKFPRTYAETSKSGQGIHLHYIYDGDPTKLSRVYDDNIEIKVFTGDSSLRRKLTKCNDLPIAHISSGLPLKGGSKSMIDFEGMKSEKALRTLIKRNLAKDIHPATKPSVDFIKKILDEAYDSGMHYDVTDLRPAIMAFAANSTNQSTFCLKLVAEMKFHSEDASLNNQAYDSDLLIFYDVEVFPNLFVVVYKAMDQKPVTMINPSPSEIEELCKFKLIGFNCRRYDNHILYARMLGYTEYQLYDLSRRIINRSENAMFREAYNLSYTDIYDFSSKKQSLKKFEIELGVHHQELGLPWDEPVPQEQWQKVADYCINDVISTEATFKARHEDFVARQILASISGLSVNDTSNMHTTKIIFGSDPNPQKQFVYTDLSEDFPGYKYEAGKSTYKGEDPGEGGYVYSEPGMYTNVALLDIASMHPHSIIALNLFGDKYTKRFKDLVDARVYIKHGDFEKAGELFDGRLKPYLTDKEQASTLSKALKIPINSVYGLTAAKFDNKFRDRRNIDNIVAKRGALFMIDLKNKLQDQGIPVAHVKTDSVKIPNADKKTIDFIIEYGKKWGYDFELEATYDKLCLVNDAVYIAREGDHWTATGKQFQVPYVFKTLFSHEEIKFEDMCEVRAVSGDADIFLDFNEEDPESHNYRFVGRVGNFCPVKSGTGGGTLLRRSKDDEGKDRYTSVSGTKNYRWKEAELIKTLELEDQIDRQYYRELVDGAVETISKYGDFDDFVRR